MVKIHLSHHDTEGNVISPGTVTDHLTDMYQTGLSFRKQENKLHSPAPVWLSPGGAPSGYWDLLK